MAGDAGFASKGMPRGDITVLSIFAFQAAAAKADASIALRSACPVIKIIGSSPLSAILPSPEKKSVYQMHSSPFYSLLAPTVRLGVVLLHYNSLLQWFPAFEKLVKS
jgi:hypothetical protein